MLITDEIRNVQWYDIEGPLPSENMKDYDEYFALAILRYCYPDLYMDFEKLNGLGINKAVVEFLRVNHWIQKWFDLDYSKYVLKEGGYIHLPLEEKIRVLSKIKGMSVTVCEDVKEHYDYWKNNFNPNPDDCCNLRFL